MSETWATALLGLHIALLIFGFGLPAVALEVSASASERRALLRYKAGTDFLELPLVVVCGLSILVLVLGLSTEEPVAPKIWLIGFVRAGAVSGLLGFGFLAWKRSRSPVFAAASARIERAWKNSKSSGQRKEILEDFFLLGTEAGSIQEKLRVVRGAESIAVELQSLPSYDGANLDELLAGLLRIVVSSDGSPEVERFVIRCVRRLKDTISAKRLEYSRDDCTCREILERVATEALEHDQEAVAIDALGGLRRGEWEILFVLKKAMELGKEQAAAVAFKRAVMDFMPEVDRDWKVVRLVAIAMVATTSGEQRNYWNQYVERANLNSLEEAQKIPKAIRRCYELQYLDMAKLLREYNEIQTARKVPP